MTFYIRNKILFLWSTAIIFNIITFFLIYRKTSEHSSQLALKYNVISGVEWYGSGNNLYFFPIAGLIITAMNGFLTQYLKKKNVLFLIEIASFTSFCFQFILMLGVLFLMRVN